MVSSAASFPWLALSLYIIVFLPGLLLVIAGVRGRRVDDHPVCRGCGFDLIGTIEPIPDKHPKCPECGTRREPKVGNRVRRRKLALAGWLLIVLSLGSLGYWGYERFGAEQLATYKPVWWLRFDARLSSGHTASVALDELLSRWGSGSLSAATGEALLDDAVAHGPAGDAALINAPVGSKWDQLAAELMHAGHGSAAEREAIARSWVELSIQLRPQVRVGEAVPMRIHRRLLGPPSPFKGNVRINNATIEVDGQVFSLGMSGGGGGSATRGSGSSGGSTGTALRPGRELPSGLKPGVYTATFALPIEARDGYNGSLWAQWTQTQTTTFEVVASDGDPIAMVNDPVAAGAIEQRTTVQDSQIEVKPYGSSISIDIEAGVNAPIAYRLKLRRGDQVWDFGSISAQLKNAYGFGTGGKVPDELEDGAIVDLVFEPSAEVARKTVDLTEILDHRFVIEGVRIVRPGGGP